MAQQLYFSRDSKMFLEIDDDVWKIPVLEGFSFSQATNTSEITLNEMESTAGVSRRGRRAFNDSLAPVDFSFSTYIRPCKSAGTGTGKADSTGNHHAVEEVLWALFSGGAAYSGYDFGTQTTPTTTHMDISFSGSNVSELGSGVTANIYFELGDASKLCYKLAKIVLNEASIDFDIDGVATIAWSGFADRITEFSDEVTLAAEINGTAATFAASSLTATDHNAGGTGGSTNRRIAGTAANGMKADNYLSAVANATTATLAITDSVDNATVLTLLGPNPTVYEGWNATNNFIRNRLTKCFITVNDDPAGALEDDYTLTLTGGNITLSNNITYLTPEELGIVNVPIGHVTGTRNFGGSMTCYLTENTATVKASKDFFKDLSSEAQRTQVSNDMTITFLIGGGTAVDSGITAPGLQVKMANCHVDIPTHSVEDIITLETTFMALPSTIEEADEVALRYVGQTITT